ncbi:MAG: hypothetical protein U0003_01075 [Vampirovibrionales bacterium]
MPAMYDWNAVSRLFYPHSSRLLQGSLGWATTYPLVTQQGVETGIFRPQVPLPSDHRPWQRLDRWA